MGSNYNGFFPAVAEAKVESMSAVQGQTIKRSRIDTFELIRPYFHFLPHFAFHIFHPWTLIPVQRLSYEWDTVLPLCSLHISACTHLLTSHYIYWVWFIELKPLYSSVNMWCHMLPWRDLPIVEWKAFLLATKPCLMNSQTTAAYISSHDSLLKWQGKQHLCVISSAACTQHAMGSELCMCVNTSH